MQNLIHGDSKSQIDKRYRKIKFVNGASQPGFRDGMISKDAAKFWILLFSFLEKVV